ncbi:MAG: hypothetical protein V1870_04710 [Candidatus Aenigmatarchaeota archaeon]
MAYDLVANREIVIRPYNIESEPDARWHRIKLYTLKSYRDIIGDATDANVVLSNALKQYPEIARDHLFSIAFAFGFEKNNNPVEGIDIFSCRLKKWENEPIYDSWTFENGVYIPRENGNFYGTEAMILGKEEELRRQTEDPKSFLATWPEI